MWKLEQVPNFELFIVKTFYKHDDAFSSRDRILSTIYKLNNLSLAKPHSSFLLYFPLGTLGSLSLRFVFTLDYFTFNK